MNALKQNNFPFFDFYKESAEAQPDDATGQASAPSASQAIRPFRLLVEHMSGVFESMTFDFAQECVAIGRTMDNEVTLSNVLKRVSRNHAEIRREGGRFWLVDVGSKNATVLNGQRLEAQRCYALRHGDRFQVGDYQIDFALE